MKKMIIGVVALLFAVSCTIFFSFLAYSALKEVGTESAELFWWIFSISTVTALCAAFDSLVIFGKYFIAEEN